MSTRDDAPDWILEDVKQTLDDKAKEEKAFDDWTDIDSRLLSKEQILTQFENAATVEGQKVLDAGDVSGFFSVNEEGDGSSTLWLVCFTDCMALMLTFFVLLYSISVPQETKWKNMLQSFDETLVPYRTLSSYSGAFDFTSIGKKSYQSALNLNYLASLLDEQFNGDDGVGNIYISRGHDRVVISLLSSFSFTDDTTQLNNESRRVLIRLAEVLSNISNRVEVVGLVDGGAMSSHDDNGWSSSLLQAINVAAFLRYAGYEADVAVRGAYAADKHIVSNEDLPAEVRAAMSRRVDLIVMSDNGRPYKFTPSLSSQ